MKFPLRTKIENGGRDGGDDKNWKINQHRANASSGRHRTGPRRWVLQNAKAGEQKIGEVSGQVGGGFDLDEDRQFASPEARQNFFTGLDRTFSPAMLLGFQAVNINWQLRRRDDVAQENELPPA